MDLTQTKSNIKSEINLRLNENNNCYFMDCVQMYRSFVDAQLKTSGDRITDISCRT